MNLNSYMSVFTFLPVPKRGSNNSLTLYEFQLMINVYKFHYKPNFINKSSRKTCENILTIS